MSLIEQTQKTVLFEETAKHSLLHSDLLGAREVYQDLFDVQDIGAIKYGLPLTQHYPAVPGQNIDIERIRKYFENLYRDYKVLDLSLGSVEDQMAALVLETWSRVQRAKNRADYLAKIAETEKLKSIYQSLWSFTETFNQTDSLDMQQTTAWIDTSEGSARLPTIGFDTTIHPQNIKIVSYTVPTGGDTLSSSPDMAIDGLANTNWRCIFTVPDTQAEMVLEFSSLELVSAITLDPIGFGVDIEVQLQDKAGVWITAIKEILYKKTTFAVDNPQIKKAKIIFKPAESILPKAVGLREIIFYNTKISNTARVQTKLLKPTYPYTEIRIAPVAQIPDGAKIYLYYSPDAVTWTKLINDDWSSVAGLSTTVLTLDDQEEYKGAQSFNSIYRINVNKPSSAPNSGKLEIGVGQMEVSCFRKDWGVQGDVLRILNLSDFTPGIPTTWTQVAPRVESEILASSNSMIAQLYTQTIYNPPYSLTRGEKIVTARKLSDKPYEEMLFVPLVGNSAKNTMQYGFNYRFRFRVHAREDTILDSGSYWFLQGYKQPGSPKNSETGRSYGTFSLYVNDVKVASQQIGHTVYTDGTAEAGGKLGGSWSLRLNKGWNTVELLLYVIDPIIYNTDVYQIGDPYLQLSIYPNLFDNKLQQDLGIDQILATGTRGPTTEFDLIWNLPKSPEYWAWSSDRSFFLVNQKETTAIDGFFKGIMPTSLLLYRGTDPGSLVNDLYVRADLEKDPESLAGPILQELKIFVR